MSSSIRLWLPTTLVLLGAAGALLWAASRPAEEPAREQTVLVLDDESRQKLKELAFQAAREGDVETLNAYLDSGFDINGTNDRGDTLLIVAAYNGQPRAVETLLARPGVAVDAVNRMGFTALMAAAFKGHLDIARALVAGGAVPDAAGESGKTALMFATLTGRVEMAEYLRSVGANR